MLNYYQILGVEKNVTDKEIKSAFRKLARKHHPDVKGDPDKFREIYEAYEVLYDPKKRSEYDRIGHEGYKSQHKEYETHYPSYEEIFKAHVLKMMSTETLVDRFVGGSYPSIYIGGEGFEDPHTGDILSSAEDIRIAKMERAYGQYSEQMDKIKQSICGEINDLERLRMLAGALFNMKWLKEEELDKSLELIDEYEAKDREWRKEKALSERLKETGDPIQEKIEKDIDRETKEIKEEQHISRLNRRFAIGKNKGRPLGDDPDKRSEWRKEVKEKTKLR